jgi:hypothetical protein
VEADISMGKKTWGRKTGYSPSLTRIAGIPLMSLEASDGLDPEFSPGADSSVFVGVGLCSRRELSMQLPFEAYIAQGAAIRDAFGLRSVQVCVADCHALVNDFASPEKVASPAERVTSEIRGLAVGLRLGHVEVLKASEIIRLPGYKAILNKTPPAVGNEYVRLELADIAWHRRERGAAVKLGWVLDPACRSRGDERLFDEAYRSVFGNDIQFVYSLPGRNDDPARSRCCPYTLLSGEQRIALSADVPFVDPGFSSTQAHLAQVCQVLEGFVGPAPDQSTLRQRIDRLRLAANADAGTVDPKVA